MDWPCWMRAAASAVRPTSGQSATAWSAGRRCDLQSPFSNDLVNSSNVTASLTRKFPEAVRERADVRPGGAEDLQRKFGRLPLQQFERIDFHGTRFQLN